MRFQENHKKQMTVVMLLVCQTQRGDFGYISGHMQLPYVYGQLLDCGEQKTVSQNITQRCPPSVSCYNRQQTSKQEAIILQDRLTNMSIDLSDQHVHALSLALASKCSILRGNEYNFHFCLADSWLQNLQTNLSCYR